MVTGLNRFQRAVLDFVAEGSGHGVVEATAGSGKTTTLVRVAELLRSRVLQAGERACFLAFNRSTAAELRARAPAVVETTTIHALGRRMLARLLGGRVGEPSEQKYVQLAQELASHGAGGSVAGVDPGPAGAYLARLAELARLELTDVADAGSLADLAARYALGSPVPDATSHLHGLLPRLLDEAVLAGRRGLVDFTDMVYLPVRLQLQPPRFAFVCVDEAQDLSHLTLALVMRLVSAGARALFVGDPRQAIYAFAGADARSLERITARTSATVLPLSVSFRCPSRHVALARRFAGDMLAAPGAQLGTVTLAQAADLPRLAAPGDLVIARTNAPLMGLALALAGRGVPARVLGDDLAVETLALATRLFPDGVLADARHAVRDAAAREARELELRLLVDDGLPAALDRSATAHAALDLGLAALERHWRGGIAPGGGRGRPLAADPWRHAPTLDDLAAVLARLLGPSADEAAPGDDHVLLSTIHRAKGREAGTVFIYLPEQLGLPLASEDEEGSEGNVLFVALTRARSKLVLVEAQRGAIAARLDAAADGPPRGLARKWCDVLRLALVMARGAAPLPRQRIVSRSWAPPGDDRLPARRLTSTGR